MKAASVLVVLVLGMGASSLAGEDGDEGMEVVFSEQDVSCSQYCGATYPEHTYPDVSRLISALVCIFLSLSHTHAV